MSYNYYNTILATFPKSDGKAIKVARAKLNEIEEFYRKQNKGSKMKFDIVLSFPSKPDVTQLCARWSEEDKESIQSVLDFCKVEYKYQSRAVLFYILFTIFVLRFFVRLFRVIASTTSRQAQRLAKRLINHLGKFFPHLRFQKLFL